MAAVGLSDCRWLVKNTFLELGFEHGAGEAKGLRRSLSECRMASMDAMVADTPSKNELEDEKLETASKVKVVHPSALFRNPLLELRVWIFESIFGNLGARFGMVWPLGKLLALKNRFRMT